MWTLYVCNHDLYNAKSKEENLNFPPMWIYIIETKKVGPLAGKRLLGGPTRGSLHLLPLRLEESKSWQVTWEWW